jgi:ATP-dependent protease ClpP protease subunit
MIGTIYINGEIGLDTTLLDVIKQVKAQSTSESFLVKIDSVGGYVDAGNDIYNYLKNLSVPVTTYTTKAYSIASVIFMAGETRIIPEGCEGALMIHLPWMEAVGDYSTLNEYLSELKATEDSLVKFYSEAIQIDKETIHSLLKSETYLNATQAIELGFATQLQVAQKAVARLHNNKEEKEESLMNKLNKKIDALMNMVSGKLNIKAELILQDATGVELVFADLDATEVASVDAKVTVDGKDADGEFLMPDGSTITAVKGVITEIAQAEVETPAEEQTDVTAEPNAKAEIVKQIGKYEMEVINTTFELGEVMKYTYDSVDYAVSANEYELADGRSVVTDADGVIVEVKEASTPAEQAPVEDVPVENNSEVEKMLAVIEAMAAKQLEIEIKYMALAKSVGSDFKSEQKENKTSINVAKNEVTSFAIKRK